MPTCKPLGIYETNTAQGMPDSGQIQLIVGPMFAGKTTELIRRLRRFHVSNNRCVLIKYSKDNRYDKENVSTHDKVTMAALICAKLESVEAQAGQYDVIGVDEGQFFPDIKQFCETMANLGKIVIVSALDGTYLREGFPQILQLFPLAESVIKLSAVCMICYREAAFTKRLGNETELEVIGGADKYMAVCRTCHSKNNKIIHENKK